MLILQNLASALLGKPMLFFGLRLVAKATDNEIDDNIVNLTEAAMDGDVQAIQKYAKLVLEETVTTIKEKSDVLKQ